MPPKKLPVGSVSSPTQQINDLSANITRFRTDWKQDFNELAVKLRKELKGEILGHISKNGKTDDDIITCVEEKINIELRAIEETWNKKFENITEEIKVIKMKLQQNYDKMDAVEQYGRNNSLIVHGLPETVNENTYIVATDFLNTHFKGSFIQTDFMNIHRMGKKKTFTSETDGSVINTRPIIIKFIRMEQRNNIFRNKKMLKGTRITIVENLTSERSNVLFKLRKNEVNCWTLNGNIILLENDVKRTLNKLSEMNKFLDSRDIA